MMQARGKVSAMSTVVWLIVVMLSFFSRAHSEELQKEKTTDNITHLIQNKCSTNKAFLIKEACFEQHEATNASLTRTKNSSDERPDKSKCRVRFSLPDMSRIYRAVDINNETSLQKIGKELSRKGKYSIKYKCVNVRLHTRDVCDEHEYDSKKDGQPIIIFPFEQRKKTTCNRLCHITPISEHPLKWRYQLLFPTETFPDDSNHVSYEELRSLPPKKNQEKRLNATLFEENDLHKGVKIVLRFRISNLTNVVRFWLDLDDKPFSVTCHKDHGTTPMTAGTTQPSNDRSTFSPRRKRKDGLPGYIFLATIGVLVAAVFLGVFIAKRRERRRKLRSEETSHLLSVPPGFTSQDLSLPSQHHDLFGNQEPTRAATSSTSDNSLVHMSGQVAAGSGIGANGEYDCLDHHGIMTKQKKGSGGGGAGINADDDYHHVLLHRADSTDYQRFQREPVREVVIDNPYDSTAAFGGATGVGGGWGRDGGGGRGGSAM